jgi:hypothetical protein
VGGDVIHRRYAGPTPPPPYDCPSCADRDAQLDRLGDELAEAKLEIARLQIERDGFGISATAWATDLQKAGKEIARLSSLLFDESELRFVADASLHNLERAVRKVVRVCEALQFCLYWEATDSDGRWKNKCSRVPKTLQQATDMLADPIIIKLGRE